MGCNKTWGRGGEWRAYLPIFCLPWSNHIIPHQPLVAAGEKSLFNNSQESLSLPCPSFCWCSLLSYESAAGWHRSLITWPDQIWLKIGKYMHIFFTQVSLYGGCGGLTCLRLFKGQAYKSYKKHGFPISWIPMHITIGNKMLLYTFNKISAQSSA